MRFLLVCLQLVMLTTLAHGGPNGDWEGTSAETFSPVQLPANHLWYYSAVHAATIGPDGQGGWMSAPPQSDLWQINIAEPALLSITDIAITGDAFEVYLDGAFLLNTPSVPFNQQPQIEPDAPGPAPFQRQAALDSAFADPRYSSATEVIEPGTHLLNVKGISFPPGVGGAGFGLRLENYPTGTESSSWGQVKRLFQ